MLARQIELVSNFNIKYKQIGTNKYSELLLAGLTQRARLYVFQTWPICLVNDAPQRRMVLLQYPPPLYQLRQTN